MLLTRGNEASLEIRGLMSAQDFQRLEQSVRQLAGTQLLFDNGVARIYRLAP